MGLLFYGGVMELSWIIGLALYVAAEKLLPAGPWLSRGSALVLIGWGLWVLAGAVPFGSIAASRLDLPGHHMVAIEPPQETR